MTRILVTGACGPAGRSLLDQLAARGVAAVGCDLAPAPRPDCEIIGALPANHPGYLPQLRGFIADFDVDLLIPTVQEELPIVAASGIPQALISPIGAVEVAADKWLTHQRLAAAGIAVPVTYPAEEAPADAALGSPALSKPRISRGGRGIIVHESGDLPRTPGLIVSEFVPGAEYCVQVVRGIGDVAVVLEKTALREGRVGNADAVRRVDAPDIAELAVAACDVVGIHGPCDLDVRRRADGDPVVLEINARFGAQSAHAPELLDAVLAAR